MTKSHTHKFPDPKEMKVYMCQKYFEFCLGQAPNKRDTTKINLTN